MARAVLAVGLWALAVLLAGCAGSEGKEAGASDSPSASVQANAEALPDAGSIAGTVVDDTLAPIMGAQVAILDLDLRVTTDASGTFAFGNLAPGTYEVAASALGYTSAAKAVTANANENTPMQFGLTQLANAFVEPYVELLGPYSWYFDCREGNAALTGPCIPVGTVAGVNANPNDKASQNFTMTDDVVDFVGEMRWQQGSFASSRNLRMSFSYEGRPNTHWFCTETSGTPLQWHYNLPDALEDPDEGCKNQAYCGVGASQGLGANSGEHEVPTVDDVLLVYTNTPFGCPNAAQPTNTTSPTNAVELAVQQRLEVVITLFHGEAKPEGYTGFPDA